MADDAHQEEVRRWLEAQAEDPAQRAIMAVFAARCALRAVPALAVLVDAGGRLSERFANGVVLLVCRAMAAPWVTAVYPIRGAGLPTKAASGSAAAAATYAARADSRSAATDVARATASGASAAAAAYAAVARAASDASSYSDSAAAAYDDAVSYFHAAATDDMAALDRGSHATELARSALWRASVENPLIVPWRRLSAALLERDEDWEVWVNWYNARLRGRVTYSHLTAKQNEEIELARVLELTEGDWNQGPAHVNARIREIEARFHSKNAPDVSEDEDRRDGIDVLAREGEIVRLVGDPETDDEDAKTSQPITIPPQKPAAIEPVWEDGVLRLPAGPASTDGTPETLDAALSALHATLDDLVSTVGEVGNVDARVTAYLRDLLGRVPQRAPHQADLFRLAHEEVVLTAYAETVSQEWPDLLAARYQAFVLMFQRTVRQFPDWRAFVANAEGRTLDRDAMASVAKTAAALQAELASEDAREFVDKSIPDALSDFGDALATDDVLVVIEAGKEALAVDLLDGIENTLKRISEAALVQYLTETSATYISGVSAGIRKTVRESGEKDGGRLVKWSRRFLIGGAASFVAWSTGSGPIARLAARFPEIREWLEPIIKLLMSI